MTDLRGDALLMQIAIASFDPRLAHQESVNE